MYLKINDTKKSLTEFSHLKDKFIFVFSESISSEDFTNVSVAELYSDDDIYLAEYGFENFDVVINANALCLKGKNFVEDVEAAKSEMIQRSKELLAEWLSENPHDSLRQ